jgi:hypothetical protein
MIPLRDPCRIRSASHEFNGFCAIHRENHLVLTRYDSSLRPSRLRGFVHVSESGRRDTGQKCLDEIVGPLPFGLHLVGQEYAVTQHIGDERLDIFR